MGMQIIKTPNGKYCLYSSIVENVTHYNLEQKDIIKILVKEITEQITKEVDRVILELSEGKKPYYQFTLSFEEMLKMIKILHGKEEMKKIKSEIESKT
jgi:hypothetical protein